MTPAVRRTRVRLLFRIAAVASTSAILAMCLLPHRQLPAPPLIPHLDKVAHALAFFVEGLLLRAARLDVRRALALGVGLAVLTEVLQSALPSLGRSGDLLDVLADVAGVALGVALFARIARTSAATRA